MFIGHFALGLGAKKYAPQVSLGVLFLAWAFWVDHNRAPRPSGTG